MKFNYTRLFVYLLIGIVFSSQYIAPQANAITPGITREPVIEPLDLIINGTGGVFVNITKDFDIVMRIIWHIDFAASFIDFGNFADDTALTNGLLVFYNDVSVLNGGGAIKRNDDLAHLGYDINILEDGRSPKDFTILGRLSFFKINVDGLKIEPGKSLAFLVQDDMTALSSLVELEIFVEGYKIVRDTYFDLPFESKYLPNSINEISLIFLFTNRNYNLKINSTTEEFWVNFTAKTETVKIIFNKQLNPNTKTLFLFLFVDNTFLEKKSLVVQTTSNSPVLSLITTFGIIIVIGIAAYVIVMLISGGRKNFR